MAQSCGATGKEFARYWIHNGFVQVNQEKMSKSLGNFFTIREIFEKSEWPEAETGETLRYFLLATQYRSPLDFSDQSLKEAKKAVDGFYDLFTRLNEPEAEGRTIADRWLRESIERCKASFDEAMNDDFNTPVAIAELQRLRSDVNKLLDQGISTETRKIARREFLSIGDVLGLFQLDKWQFNPLKVSAHSDAYVQCGLSESEIENLLNQRNEARRRKDFKRADEIRKSLAAQGIIIEDKPDGTSRWKR
jgi:cysteinyl-tRNA synthetase